MFVQFAQTANTVSISDVQTYCCWHKWYQRAWVATSVM